MQRSGIRGRRSFDGHSRIPACGLHPGYERRGASTIPPIRVGWAERSEAQRFPIPEILGLPSSAQPAKFLFSAKNFWVFNPFFCDKTSTLLEQLVFYGCGQRTFGAGAGNALGDFLSIVSSRFSSASRPSRRSANLVFLPAAKKLLAHVGRLVSQRELLVDGLVCIANGDNPRIIESRLQGYDS